MSSNLRKIISAGAFLSVLALAQTARADRYDSVEEIWDRYCHVVANRDEVEVLSCYDENLRKQLAGDKTAAGRARLSMHMGDMFELLVRDYDLQVTDQKESGSRATYTVKFKHRKKHTEHTSTVEFVSDGSRWFVSKSPDTPDFLKPGSGSTAMIVGIVVALVAVGLVAKKFLK